MNDVLLILFFTLFLSNNLYTQESVIQNVLPVEFNGDAKIEIGSSNCGLEFHHSKALPQRISFYKPLANSIDNSRDYWTRDTSFVVHALIEIDNVIAKNLEELDYITTTTPYSAKFTTNIDLIRVDITYEFVKTKSAYVVSYTFKNTSDISKNFLFTTKLVDVLRSCHTYSLFKSQSIQELNDITGLLMNYPYKELGNSSVYLFDLTEGNYIHTDQKENHLNYTFNLEPNQGISIVQVVGMTRQESAEQEARYLSENLKDEIAAFSNYMLNVSESAPYFRTGDDFLDHSVYWGKSMLEANRHFIDGSQILMPCPAEYNFFFTHDVLLSDLAVAKYNPERVKEDLKFIVKYTNEENVIPHAYYWKDSSYVTEYAGEYNWNHLWFNIVCGTYLKHSGDKSFLKSIYPIISNSLNTILDNKIIDGLVHSNRPDWWDAGENPGPRSYMTILTYKAIMEYISMSRMLGIENDFTRKLTETALMLKTNLVSKLWSDDHNYLMNYLEDGQMDEHLYMGVIIALHYDLLDDDHAAKMLATIEKQLLDPAIGIYNVAPMDIDKQADLLGLKNGEEGKYGYYFNGGIWTHANAFYILGLIKTGFKQKAFEYLKKLMTVKGIAQSPAGQPAMFEYRVAKGEDYGTIDKPNFSWAASWYLYCLYNLFSAKETFWNITLDPFLEKNQRMCEFITYAYGKKIGVSIKGQGPVCKKIKINGEPANSLVLPHDISGESNYEILLGEISEPYLNYVNTYLETCNFNDNRLRVNVKYIPPEGLDLTLVSRMDPSGFQFNGVEVGATVKRIDKNTLSVFIIPEDCNEGKLVIEFN